MASHKLVPTKFVVEKIEEGSLFPYFIRAYSQADPNKQWHDCDFVEEVSAKWFSQRAIYYIKS